MRLFRSSRGVVAACLAGLASAAFAQQPPGGGERLPQRNLLVELRQTDGSSGDGNVGGIRSGSVTIGPNGEVRPRADVTIGSTSQTRGADSTQMLRVLNGGQGLLSTGVSQPVTWYAPVWTPQGQGVVGTTGLVDVGRRVAVRPRWPGGVAPVTVEIRSEASAMAGGGSGSRYGLDGRPLPEGSTETAGLLTTLQLPLGEWVTVAGTEQSAQRSDSGTVYRSESRTQSRSLLQMRVSAP
ncbi:MAG TPA: hypothetical protein VFR90_07570 [Methylibium sp.]|uniref:hypothetical protein n=1 Tax=Methylibium sp. TaxID=2067992 RepID=UPI002DBFF884|nr:hypothetical protein [Methylibium sp.]HEU4458965.1 hypothetical protein [Methylibium sp.]